MATTAVEFESPDAMTPDCAKALRHLLLAVADTKLLLGYHYGEWTFGPPELEAAVASCSLAQTELGHVRLLHGILKKHYGDDPDRLVDARPADAFANVRYLDVTLPDWAGFVAANFVVDLAVTRLVHALQGSSFKPLRMSLEKMVDEERHHAHHGRGWFRSLAARSRTTREALAGQVSRALEAVIDWFGPADDVHDRVLIDAGVKAASNADILAAFEGDLSAAAAPVDLDVSVPQRADWTGWDPVTRRIGGGGPGDDILYHLRGSKNEVFKLSS